MHRRVLHLGIAASGLVLTVDARAQGHLALTRLVFVAVSTPPRSSVLLPTAIGPSVVIATSTSEFSIVRIPAPAAFPSRVRVYYTVTPLVDGALVGKLTGSLTPSAPGDERSILFAVRSPRYLNAGETKVALARFSTPSEAVEIPVIAQNAIQRGISVSPRSRLVVARPGVPLRVDYRLTNTGNAPDSVSLKVQAPAGWVVPGATPVILLAPRRWIDQGVHVVPPPGASGIATLRLIVIAQGRVVAEVPVDVQLVATATVISTSGPTLRVGAGAASGPWSGVSAIQSLDLQGPVSDGLTVRARAASAPDEPAAHYAFSQANLASVPFVLQVAGTDWRVDGGTFGTTISDLSGANLVGRGVSAGVKRGTWSASAVAATPDAVIQDASGTLSGGRLEYSPGPFAVSTAMTHLREDRGSFSRQLDAWSLGGMRDDFIGGQLRGEIAHRRIDGRSAPGWSASYGRRSPDENIEVRYLHAPGGSGAFARATSDLAISAGRRLDTRLLVTGTAWRTTDEGMPTVTGLRMDGWSLGAHFTAAKDVHLSVTGRESSFGASAAVGDFGSAERALAATMDVRRGIVSTQVTFNAALLRRHGALDGGGTRFTQEAPRGGVRAMLAASRDGETIAFTGQYERTGAGIGAAPVQWSYGLQLSGTPDLGLGRPLRVDAAAERVGGSFDAARAITVRAAVEMDLPLQSSIRLSVERNPWILPESDGGGGASGWMYVVGVSRTLTLPRHSSGGTRGLVFRDLNGNGRRDAGEQGLGNVALRRGADFTMTDQRGGFLLPGNEREPYEIDARSLPLGLIVPTTLIPAGTRLIGAVPVAPLLVTLALDAADSSRVSPADLARVDVIARDSAGTAWMPRRTSDSTVVFDALPPGSYSIDVDATGSREPLRLADASRIRTVTTGRVPISMRILLRGRQLRFQTSSRLTR